MPDKALVVQTGDTARDRGSAAACLHTVGSRLDDSIASFATVIDRIVRTDDDLSQMGG